MQTFAQGLSLFALKVDEPMRDMIFVEEIVNQVPIARAIRRDDAQAGELAVAQQTLAALLRAAIELVPAGLFR